MIKRMLRWWNQLQLKLKIGIGTFLSFILIFTAVLISFWTFYSYLNQFSVILDQHSENQKLRETFNEEQNAFKKYAWDRTREYRENYEHACSKMEFQLGRLSTDYASIGRTAYLETMAILNGYEGYHQQIDELLQLNTQNENFIPLLYTCYNTESYLVTYIDRLVNTSLSEGNQQYNAELELVQKLPVLWIVLGVFLILNVLFLIRYFFRLFARPMLNMAAAANELSKKNYSIPDLPVTSRDEIGNLIHEFNEMKHSTANYIDTLQEKNKMEKQLHDTEIRQLQMEQGMSEMKLKLLRSQINPHFLFNTLNIISGMARIEDAGNTYEMTQRLSKLFRYNLKTDSKIVPMCSEIDIAKDYFYIQQRRFGDRIQLDWDIQPATTELLIPVFTFQPLLENAILHGIAPKEEGGIIRIRTYIRDDRCHLLITDNGTGISKEKLQLIRQELNNGNGSHIGIGVANVKARFEMIYPGSQFKIVSKTDVGTSIQITWTPAAIKI